MSKYELVSTIIASISTLIAIISIIIAKISLDKSTKLNREYNNYVAGQVELSINERITSTKNSTEDLVLLMPNQQERTNDPEKAERFEKVFKSKVENNLNAYEEACAKYIDGKVDRERFKKSYKVEIRNLVESDEFKNYFDTVKSRYKAILKVYKEWEDLENN